MDRSEIEELLSAYADDELTQAQQEAVELHLTICADCRRALAEFRLVGKRLALLADPTVNRWEPDVTARVAARIQRRRRWAIWGRGLAVRAAGMLAAGAVLVGAIWLLGHLPSVPAADESRSSAPLVTRVVAPTDAPAVQPTSSPTARHPTVEMTPLILQTPGDEATLYLLDATVLLTPPAQDALRNLGYRLGADGGNAFVIVQIGSEQMVLDSGAAPSIFLPTAARPGDQVQVFAATSGGAITPAAEFTLERQDGAWHVINLRQSAASPTLQVELPIPMPEAADLFQPTPLAPRPEVTVRLERVYVTPAQPRQGQPFTVTAVIRNEGASDARVPVWFGAFRPDNPYPVGSSLIYYVTIPTGQGTELSWNGRDRWEPAKNASLENPHLIMRASVNVIVPGQWPLPALLPETDKLDNQAEIIVNFLPYEPLVSDACPPGDNLWVELDQGRVYQDFSRQSALRLIVHNDGNTELVRMPLRITDAGGVQYLTYVRRVPPCGGAVNVEETSISADRLTYPITITLNPSDARDAVPEGERGDNVLVVGEYAACTGDTDLWLTDQDVSVDGADLLVTVHLSGSSPNRSFSVHVYHTADGRLLASEQVSQITCEEPLLLRFEGILSGLAGGYVMVQIDTQANRVEPVYPQNNNSAIVRIANGE